MIREAILHFDPLQTQVKTEIIDQNGLHRVKYIENDELMHANPPEQLRTAAAQRPAAAELYRAHRAQRAVDGNARK